MKFCKIPSDERFFFGASPSLQLPLGGDGIGYPIKLFMKHESYRATSRGVAAKGTRIVLRDTLL